MIYWIGSNKTNLMIGDNVTNKVCNENIANNLIDKISELLDAEVNYYHCYDSDNPTHRYKKIIIEYGKEKN